MKYSEETRDRFEERAFALYFIKSIRRVDDKAQFPYRVNCEDKETFTRKDEEGHYVRDELNLMWIGWNLKIESDEQERKYGKRD